uniref:Ig-like domain-containing protein n=1 Tax=Timema poppense TaxID=170557 RepID=A0A7R9H2T4_TIMPO|nr:unnamed protein product [Timema poppensis]
MLGSQSIHIPYYSLGVAFQPEFAEAILNQTVAVGRDATFKCVVQHLGGYRGKFVDSFNGTRGTLHLSWFHTINKCGRMFRFRMTVREVWEVQELRMLGFRMTVREVGEVGWVKADTKAIQAIHDHVITHNPRVSVSHNDYSIWNLHVKNVQEEDRGMYMCQINTDPMKSQVSRSHDVDADR